MEYLASALSEWEQVLLLVTTSKHFSMANHDCRSLLYETQFSRNTLMIEKEYTFLMVCCPHYLFYGEETVIDIAAVKGRECGNSSSIFFCTVGLEITFWLAFVDLLHI